MKRRRPVIVALAFVAAILVFEYAFLMPKSEMIRESIRTQYEALQKYDQIIRSAGGIEREMKDSAQEMEDMGKRLLAEKSSFLASARMQREISDLTRKNGLMVMSMRPLSGVKVNHYTVIPVYFEGNGTIKQVSDFLRALEAHELLLKVERLNLNITNMQRPNDLRFKMQISGLAKS